MNDSTLQIKIDFVGGDTSFNKVIDSVTPIVEKLKKELKDTLNVQSDFVTLQKEGIKLTSQELEQQRQIKAANEKTRDAILERLKSTRQLSDEDKKQLEISKAKIKDAEKILALNEKQSKMSSMLKSVGESVGNSLKMLAPAVLAFKVFEDVINKVTDQIKTVVNSLISGLTPTLQPIIDTFTLIGKTLKPIFNEIFASLKVVLESVGDVFANLMKSFAPLIDVLMQALKPVLDIIIQVATSVTDILKPELMEAIVKPAAAILQLLTPILQMLSNILIPALQTITNLASGIVDVFTNLADAVLGGVVNGINKLMDGLSAIVSTDKKSEQSLRERQVLINAAVASQDKLLQKIMDGEKLTAKEIEQQRELLVYLEQRRIKNGKYTDEELKQREKARKIISQNNIANANEMMEQVRAGQDITKQLKEQNERMQTLNKLKQNGVNLTREEKEELRVIKDLQNEIANAKNEEFVRRKELGVLSSAEIEAKKQEVALLKQKAIELERSGDAAAAKEAYEIWQNAASALGDVGANTKVSTKSYETWSKEIKDSKAQLASLTLELERIKQLSELDTESQFKKQFEFDVEDIEARFNEINSLAKLSDKQLNEMGKNRKELNEYIIEARKKADAEIELLTFRFNEKLKANEKEKDAQLLERRKQTQAELIELQKQIDLDAKNNQLKLIEIVDKAKLEQYKKTLNEIKNLELAALAEERLAAEGITDDATRIAKLEILKIKENQIIEKYKQQELDITERFNDEVDKSNLQRLQSSSELVIQYTNSIINNISSAIEKNKELEKSKTDVNKEIAELKQSYRQRETAHEEYVKKIAELEKRKQDIEAQSNNAYLQGLKATLKEGFANMLDAITQQLIAKQIATVAELTASSFTTFGASLLGIAPVIAAITAANAALKGLVLNFADGGVVPKTAYNKHGVDSQPAMLMPHEVIMNLKAAKVRDNTQAVLWSNKTGGHLADYYANMNNKDYNTQRELLNETKYLYTKLELISDNINSNIAEFNNNIELWKKTEMNRKINITANVQTDGNALLKEIKFKQNSMRAR
mgnify:CR=1 FL=1